MHRHRCIPNTPSLYERVPVLAKNAWLYVIYIKHIFYKLFLINHYKHYIHIHVLMSFKFSSNRIAVHTHARECMIFRYVTEWHLIITTYIQYLILYYNTSKTFEAIPNIVSTNQSHVHAHAFMLVWHYNIVCNINIHVYLKF